MNQHAAAQRLHDRATRGESLTAEEQATLELWYAEQDREEGIELAHAREPPSIRKNEIDPSFFEVEAMELFDGDGEP